MALLACRPGEGFAVTRNITLHQLGKLSRRQLELNWLSGRSSVCAVGQRSEAVSWPFQGSSSDEDQPSGRSVCCTCADVPVSRDTQERGPASARQTRARLTLRSLSVEFVHCSASSAATTHLSSPNVTPLMADHQAFHRSGDISVGSSLHCGSECGRTPRLPTV
jgi:hypothetical protein